MDIVTLENMSHVDQHVWDDQGRRHTIEAHGIVGRSGDIASLFLKNNGKFVRVWKKRAIPEIPGEPKVWVANMTGNPAAPEELTVEQTNRKTGLKEYYKKPNPLAKPTAVSYMMHLSQERALDYDGKETALNHPPVKVEIAPFAREPISQTYANWLIMRDGQQEDDCRGRLQLCRAPSEFEPNESWDYEDIRQYGQLMSAPLDWKKDFPALSSIRADVDEIKERLLQALFFYIVDENYSLPTRAAFDAKKAGGKN